jgi:hypothetical protein
MTDKKENKETENEHRDYFRIDDVIPLVAIPVHLDDVESEEILNRIISSKAISMPGVHGSPATDEVESAITTRYEQSESDKLYDEISDIKAKLDYIINHFIMEKEGLANPEKKYVNISASGIRFTVNHPVKIKDIMEVKLLLPTYPPVAVFAYGEVKRVRDLENGKYEVAIEYVNMSDSVRNEIIQYTLSHQRETIKKFKDSR